MLGFIVRFVSGLCIGMPLGSAAYLGMSFFAFEFSVSSLLFTGFATGLAAFAFPNFMVAGILKSMVWRKI